MAVPALDAPEYPEDPTVLDELSLRALEDSTSEGSSRGWSRSTTARP